MGGTSLAGTKTSFSPGAEGEAVCEEDPEAASTPSTSKWAALHVAPRMLSRRSKGCLKPFHCWYSEEIWWIL